MYNRDHEGSTEYGAWESGDARYEATWDYDLLWTIPIPKGWEDPSFHQTGGIIGKQPTS